MGSQSCSQFIALSASGVLLNQRRVVRVIQRVKHLSEQVHTSDKGESNQLNAGLQTKSSLRRVLLLLRVKIATRYYAWTMGALMRL